MAETVEELLVSIRIDPASIRKLVDDVKAAAQAAGGEAVEIPIETNAPEVLAETTAAAEDMAASTATAADPMKESLERAQSAAQELQGGLLALVGTSGLLAVGFGGLAQAAADDETALLRLRGVFGELSDDAQAFSENLANSTGRTAGDLQGALAAFQGIQLALGKTAEESAGTSKQLVELGVALSKAAGIDQQEAFDKLQTAIRRGGSALAEFGIAITPDKLEAYAAAHNLVKSEMTDEQLVTARLNIILQQQDAILAKAAAGEQTFAEQVRQLKDAFSELASTVGKAVTGIFGPFITGITSAITAIRQFIEANPAVAQAIVAFGVVLGVAAAALAGLILAVNAVLFVERQLIAVNTLLASSYTLLTGATAASTAATTADTAATTANVAAKGGLSSLLPGLTGLFQNLGSILSTNVGTLLESAKNFLGLGGSMLNASSIAAGFGTVIGKTYNLLTSLGSALTSNIASVSALGAAAGVAAAAFVGWKIGSFINELVGFEKATENTVKGTATLGDQFKALAAASLIPIAGLVNLAVQSRKVAKAQAELKAIQQASVVGAKEFEEAFQRANRVTGQTREEFVKATEAGKSFNEGLALIQKGAERTREEEQKLQELMKQYPAIAEAFKQATEQQVDATKKFQESRRKLKESEAEFAKFTQDIAKDLIAARRGEADAAIVETRREFEERSKTIQERADLIRESVVDEAEQQRQLAELQTLASDAAEAATLKIKQTLDDRVDDLRSNADQQISEFERIRDESIKAINEEEKLILDSLKKITDARQKATEDAMSFIQRLEDAETRRRNAVVADLEQLEREAVARLKNLQFDGQRKAVVEATVKEAERLASNAEREEAARKRLAEIDKQIAEEKAKQAKEAAKQTKETNEALAKLDQQLTREKTRNELQQQSAGLAIDRAEAEAAAQERAASRQRGRGQVDTSSGQEKVNSAIQRANELQRQGAEQAAAGEERRAEAIKRAAEQQAATQERNAETIRRLEERRAEAAKGVQTVEQQTAEAKERAAKLAQTVAEEEKAVATEIKDENEGITEDRKRLAELDQERVAAENQFKAARDQVTAATDTLIAKEREFAGIQQQRLKAELEIAKARTSGTGEVAPEQKQALAGAKQATGAAQAETLEKAPTAEQFKATQVQQAETTAAFKAAATNAQKATDAVNAATAALNPVAQRLNETLLAVGQTFTPVITKMDQMLQAQADFGDKLTTFGNTVVGKFDEARRQFAAQAAALAGLSAEVEGIQLGGETEAEAAGL